jgi:acylpyruvate hydrolase
VQLVRYLTGTEAEIGVLVGNNIVSARSALKRHVQRNGTLRALAPLFDVAFAEPKAALALGRVFTDPLGEAVARDDGASVITDKGLRGVEILAFVSDPEKVFGVGYNYKELCDWESHEYPPKPELFAKMPTSITSAYVALHVTPAVHLVDFESELCVIIGRTAKRVSKENALDYVGAYTVMNELSAKILPRPKVPGKTEQLAQKAVDDFGPLGPVVITPDEIRDPMTLRMVTRVNGEQRQSFPTSDMVHGVKELIEYMSAIITLNPGDMIATGTSVGCGIVERPPRMLNNGDVVECEITGYPGTRNKLYIHA